MGCLGEAYARERRAKKMNKLHICQNYIYLLQYNFVLFTENFLFFSLVVSLLSKQYSKSFASSSWWPSLLSCSSEDTEPIIFFIDWHTKILRPSLRNIFYSRPTFVELEARTTEIEFHAHNIFDYETFLCMGDNILSFLFTCSGSYFAGLQTWDDPTGPSDEYTFKELQDEFIAACKNCSLP